MALYLYIDEVPPPTNLSVTDDKILEWNFKIPQPSDLPTDFVLIPEVNISYIVYVTDKDNVDSRISQTTYNSLSIFENLLHNCTLRGIYVQAVVNDMFFGLNSSSIDIISSKYNYGIFIHVTVSISWSSVPVFTSLSAELLLNYSVQVSNNSHNLYMPWLLTFVVTNFQQQIFLH